MPASKKIKKEKEKEKEKEPTDQANTHEHDINATLDEVKLSSRVLERTAEMQSLPAREQMDDGDWDRDTDMDRVDTDTEFDRERDGSDYEIIDTPSGNRLKEDITLRRRKRSTFTQPSTVTARVDSDQPPTSPPDPEPVTMPVLTAFSLLCTDDDNTMKVAVICGMFFMCMCCGVFSGLMIVFKFWWFWLMLALVLLSITFVPHITDVVFRSLGRSLSFGYWTFKSFTDSRHSGTWNG